MITGWAPVTNMYETVIWVALVAAVLSFIFEMIYRKVFFALAGSAVALLGTITAANVPLLDPSIKSLQPVLRSNLWLTIHVLTEVSSYAAFALAWMLGLIATIYYLTATYRRSPRFSETGPALDPGPAAARGRRARCRRVLRPARAALVARRRSRLIQLASLSLGGDALVLRSSRAWPCWGNHHFADGRPRAGWRGARIARLSAPRRMTGDRQERHSAGQARRPRPGHAGRPSRSSSRSPTSSIARCRSACS